MMGAAKVYIIRHGETQANSDGIIQGQLDTDLNDVRFVSTSHCKESSH
jgi:broad specificity phosphatase PhoE